MVFHSFDFIISVMILRVSLNLALIILDYGHEKKSCLQASRLSKFDCMVITWGDLTAPVRYGDPMYCGNWTKFNSIDDMEPEHVRIKSYTYICIN